jgi:shikimate kinase
VKNRIIYIIGFMGSGKSTAGKKLASMLGWNFIDLDKCVEEYTGKSIPDIFAQNGEEYFRKTETKLLRNINTHTNSIISTGGGTPCYSDNMDFMLNSGLTLYLKLTPAQLKSRLTGSKTERPLIKNLNPQELQIFIEEKLAEREKWYDRSDITAVGPDLDINTLFTQVRSKLSE